MKVARQFLKTWKFLQKWDEYGDYSQYLRDYGDGLPEGLPYDKNPSPEEGKAAIDYASGRARIRGDSEEFISAVEDFIQNF